MGGIRSEAFLFEDEYCLIRETVYPLSHRHGRYSFSELDDVMALWNKGGLTHTLSAEGYEKSQLFFFDTETTGLGGGAGNMIFCSVMQECMKTVSRLNSICFLNRETRRLFTKAF